MEEWKSVTAKQSFLKISALLLNCSLERNEFNIWKGDTSGQNLYVPTSH